MTKQDVYIKADTAQSLAAKASTEGKTLFAFTNEILDIVLRVLREGGSPDEIFAAWKTSRLSREVDGASFVPRNLIWKMVERLYRIDPEWMLAEWLDTGRRLGERLRKFYSTLEELRVGFSGIQSLVAEQGFELRRLGKQEGHQVVELRVVTDLSPAWAACADALLTGILGAYSFRATERQVEGRSIQITARYDP